MEIRTKIFNQDEMKNYKKIWLKTKTHGIPYLINSKIIWSIEDPVLQLIVEEFRKILPDRDKISDVEVINEIKDKLVFRKSD